MGLDKVVVVVQELRVEYLEQLVPIRIRLAERLDGVAGGEVLKVEMRRVGQRGGEGADGEVVGLGRGDFVEGDGAQGAEEVEVGLRVFARFRGDVGNFEIEFALIFFVGFPGCDPAVQVFELWAEEFEGGGAAHDAQNGEEDVVAGVAGWGEDVEDCSQDGKGETGTVYRGGLYGSGEVLTDFWEEFVEVGRLADQMDEEVVGCSELCNMGSLAHDAWEEGAKRRLTFFRSRVEHIAGGDELFEGIILLPFL